MLLTRVRPECGSGVNSENAKAIRFYEKSGFQRVGTKSFKLGETVEHDFVMEHEL